MIKYNKDSTYITVHSESMTLNVNAYLPEFEKIFGLYKIYTKYYIMQECCFAIGIS